MFIFVDVMGKKRTDGFCLFCSKADLNSNDFGCGEPIGLCGTCNHLIFYNLNVFLFYFISLFYYQTADGEEGSFYLIRVIYTMFP